MENSGKYPCSTVLRPLLAGKRKIRIQFDEQRPVVANQKHVRE